jgi:Fe/S biogenesis protein NfuA
MALLGGFMITFTDVAKEKVREFMDSAEGECAGLRVAAARQGKHRFQYNLALVNEGDTSDADVSLDQGSFMVYVDPASAKNLEGTTIDFVSDFQGAGFKFENPQSVVSWDDPLAQKVQQVIDEKITPSVAGHGGWVDLVAVQGSTAVIQFGGGCQGCGMSQVTLSEGIEKMILAEVPEIEKVVDDTDHASGENPYYSG